MTRQRGRRPPWLRSDEQERLLAETALYIRPDTAYRLALGAGLACSEIASLAVGSVSQDGHTAIDRIISTVRDGRRRDRGAPVEVPLSGDLQRSVGRYLAWRRGRCPHVERAMRGALGRDGSLRCASCGDVMNFMKAPLFVTRRGPGITADRLQREFNAFRDALGLRAWLHFDVLRATFKAGKVAVL